MSVLLNKQQTFLARGRILEFAALEAVAAPDFFSFFFLEGTKFPKFTENGWFLLFFLFWLGGKGGASNGGCRGEEFSMGDIPCPILCHHFHEVTKGKTSWKSDVWASWKSAPKPFIKYIGIQYHWWKISFTEIYNFASQKLMTFLKVLFCYVNFWSLFVFQNVNVEPGIPHF